MSAMFARVGQGNFFAMSDLFDPSDRVGRGNAGDLYYIT